MFKKYFRNYVVMWIQICRQHLAKHLTLTFSLLQVYSFRNCIPEHFLPARKGVSDNCVRLSGFYTLPSTYSTVDPDGFSI